MDCHDINSIPRTTPDLEWWCCQCRTPQYHLYDECNEEGCGHIRCSGCDELLRQIDEVAKEVLVEMDLPWILQTAFTMAGIAQLQLFVSKTGHLQNRMVFVYPRRFFIFFYFFLLLLVWKKAKTLVICFILSYKRK